MSLKLFGGLIFALIMSSIVLVADANSTMTADMKIGKSPSSVKAKLDDKILSNAALISPHISSPTNSAAIKPYMNIKLWIYIHIISNPSGAQVLEDGNDTGFLAPHDYPFSLPGNHTFELKLTGYKNYTINVFTNKTQTYNVALEKEQPKPLVLIRINSNPSGARVWIDENDTGENTPYEHFFNLQEEHTVDLKLTGYKNDEFNVFTNKTQTYNVALEKEQPKPLVLIRINSNPSGARVWIDENDTGENTPYEHFFNLQEEHTVDLKLTGYKNDEFNVFTNEEKTVNRTLEKEQPKPLVLIRINSNPSGARVWIDENDTGENTPYEHFFNLQEEHTVDLKLTGYKNDEFNVFTNEEKTVNRTLEKEQPKPLVLIRINSNPSGARVWIDENDTGENTPYEHFFNLQEEHTVDLKLTGYKNDEFNVFTNKTQTYNVALEKEQPKPLVLIRINSNPSGARVWIDENDTGENTPYEHFFNLQEEHIPLLVDVLPDDRDEHGDHDEQDQPHPGVPDDVQGTGKRPPPQLVYQHSGRGARHGASESSPLSVQPGEHEDREQVECGKGELVAGEVVQEANDSDHEHTRDE